VEIIKKTNYGSTLLVQADLGELGKTKQYELSRNDRIALTEKHSATKEQIAARYLNEEIRYLKNVNKREIGLGQQTEDVQRKAMPGLFNSDLQHKQSNDNDLIYILQKEDKSDKPSLLVSYHSDGRLGSISKGQELDNILKNTQQPMIVMTESHYRELLGKGWKKGENFKHELGKQKADLTIGDFDKARSFYADYVRNESRLIGSPKIGQPSWTGKGTIAAPDKKIVTALGMLTFLNTQIQNLQAEAMEKNSNHYKSASYSLEQDQKKSSQSDKICILLKEDSSKKVTSGTIYQTDGTLVKPIRGKELTSIVTSGVPTITMTSEEYNNLINKGRAKGEEIKHDLAKTDPSVMDLNDFKTIDTSYITKALKYIASAKAGVPMPDSLTDPGTLSKLERNIVTALGELGYINSQMHELQADKDMRKIMPWAERVSEVEINQNSVLKTMDSIHANHGNAIALFRKGDYYEAYGKDAVKMSNRFGLTLTHPDSSNGLEMVGVPEKALDTYIPKLLHAGERVAMVDTPLSQSLEESMQSKTEKTKIIKMDEVGSPSHAKDQKNEWYDVYLIHGGAAKVLNKGLDSKEAAEEYIKNKQPWYTKMNYGELWAVPQVGLTVNIDNTPIRWDKYILNQIGQSRTDLHDGKTTAVKEFDRLADISHKAYDSRAYLLYPTVIKHLDDYMHFELHPKVNAELAEKGKKLIGKTFVDNGENVKIKGVRPAAETGMYHSVFVTDKGQYNIWSIMQQLKEGKLQLKGVEQNNTESAKLATGSDKQSNNTTMAKTKKQVQQYHFQEAEELFKENVARRIDQADDKTGDPKVKQFGCTVGDIDDRGYATENAAEIVQECVVGMIMR
jgi:hypothetical protein